MTQCLRDSIGCPCLLEAQLPRKPRQHLSAEPRSRPVLRVEAFEAAAAVSTTSRFACLAVWTRHLPAVGHHRGSSISSEANFSEKPCLDTTSVTLQHAPIAATKPQTASTISRSSQTCSGAHRKTSSCFEGRIATRSYQACGNSELEMRSSLAQREMKQCSGPNLTC